MNTDKPALGFVEADAAVALTVWLNRDAIEKRLSAELDKTSGDDGLDDAERIRQTSEVSAALLECQRDLCELTWLALAERLPVACAHDLDARAILGLELVTGPHQQASPGTGREHACDVIGPR